MVYAMQGIIGASAFLMAVENNDIKSVGYELLLALGIVIINIVVSPLLQWLFDKIKTKIKSKQKTPENDGELADKLLEVVDDLQEKTEETLKNLTDKGVKNGKGKDKNK